MIHAVFQLIFKGSVMLIDIEVVSFVRIVGNKDIGVAVIVHVTDGYTQSKADEGTVDAGGFCDFCEVTVVISEEVVAAAFQEVSHGPLGLWQVASIGVVEGIDGDRAVIDHEAIQVAIVVIVEKRYLGSIGRDIQAIFCSGFCKGAILIIDVELVSPVTVLHVAGVAYIDIQPAVVIDVHKHGACAPHAVLREARSGGDVLKFEISFIQVDPVLTHIGGEEDIRQTVVIEVADGYAAAIVEVAEQEAVVDLFVHHLIVEVDACVVHQLEQCLIMLLVIAGEKQEAEGEEMKEVKFHVLNDGQVMTMRAQKKRRPL